MYLLNTLLDEYRLPYMEKQQICEESVSIKNTEKLYRNFKSIFQAWKTIRRICLYGSLGFETQCNWFF